MQKQSITVVNLLVVDIHLNIGENWKQYVVFIRNIGSVASRTSTSFRVFLLLQLLLILPCALFYFIGSLGFLTTALDKFQFQSQVRLSQINVKVPIRLKFKLYAVFIEWGRRIYFLFVRRQNIVNYCYWDFFTTISGNCHRKLLPKTARLG